MGEVDDEREVDEVVKREVDESMRIFILISHDISFLILSEKYFSFMS